MITTFTGMYSICVRNVGPIRDGYLDGFLTVDKVTVFVGDQGTGKSTIAKILSTCIWIEKSLARQDHQPSYYTKYNRFQKQIAYQGIDTFLERDSYIAYKGKAFHFVYENGELRFEDQSIDDAYLFPKIMYTPAERSFVSAVGRPDLVKRLPKPLYAFMDEYLDAVSQLDDRFALPFDNVSITRSGKQLTLRGGNYEIPLLNASSGYQTMAPMLMVQAYLTKMVKGQTIDRHQENSLQDEKDLEKKVRRIANNDKLDDDVKLLYLRLLSGTRQYQSLVSIIEEPEISLFPSSQGAILYKIIEYTNALAHNKTIITTHSPYIINYLTLAAKAHKVNQSDSLLSKPIVPHLSTISGDEIAIYHLANGVISKLPNYESLPSDENPLNDALQDFNEQFISLLEMNAEV
jgi:predicted ATPase